MVRYPHFNLIEHFLALSPSICCQRHALSPHHESRRNTVAFVAWLNLFKPISGQPTDTDLTRLHADLITTLLPLPYDVEKVIHNLLGLVMGKEYYKQRYCTKLPTPTKPTV